jgi:hypothetical protein
MSRTMGERNEFASGWPVSDLPRRGESQHAARSSAVRCLAFDDADRF